MSENDEYDQFDAALATTRDPQEGCRLLFSMLLILGATAVFAAIVWTFT